MFKNSGKKLMGFVKFVFGLNIVVAVLAVVAAGLYVHQMYGDVEKVLLAVLAAVLAMVLYLLLVFVGLLGVYAFGELAQSNVDMQRTLAEMQSSMDRMQFNQRNNVQVTSRQIPRPVPQTPVAEETPVERPVAPAPVPVAPAAAPAAAPSEPAYPQERSVSYAYDYRAAAGAPAFPVQDRAPQMPASDRTSGLNVLICSKCGARHDALSTNCRYCGTPL